MSVASYVIDALTGVERLTNGQIIDSYTLYCTSNDSAIKKDAFARMAGYRMYVLILSSRHAPASFYFFFDKKHLLQAENLIEITFNSSEVRIHHRVYANSKVTTFASAADWELTLDEAALMLNPKQVEIVVAEILNKYRKG